MEAPIKALMEAPIKVKFEKMPLGQFRVLSPSVKSFPTRSLNLTRSQS
jgi:hypothetical protein